MRKEKKKRFRDTAFDSSFCLDQGLFSFICSFLSFSLSFNGFQKPVVMK